MDSPTPPQSPKSASLRLDVALQLLQQSGVSLPGTRESNPSGWLQAVIDGLCELSSRDALTGLANRRQFELAMAREIDRVARAGEPALVLMIDIDHFKKVNDTHGHPAGDLVLREVGRALHDCIRPMDTVARFGGEEFAMILPNCPPAFGQTVAERLRTQLVWQAGDALPDAQDLPALLRSAPHDSTVTAQRGDPDWPADGLQHQAAYFKPYLVITFTGTTMCDCRCFFLMRNLSQILCY